MDNLISQSPFDGLLPAAVGAVHLSGVDLGKAALLMPYQGKSNQLSTALQKSVGLSLPAPNQSETDGAVRLLWFGRAAYLLTGTEVPPVVKNCAAVTDQTDAWVCVELTGFGVEDVLARLVPVDLRHRVFGQNATARTLVGHMNVSITRTGTKRILVMGFRSMAKTLVEELKEAMEAVASRQL